MKEEYKKAHDNIWPEYAKAVRAAGILNQSIFYKKDGTLVIYFESDDPEKSLATIKKKPLNTKWQKEMDKFIAKAENNKSRQDVEGKGSALREMRPEVEILELIFYLE